ncbi:MAG: AraC family transcriptional regulator [Planctomycetes bacterium]|nr:AraC family transcriptional regulator [Planctomycetota bacterium]
MTERPSSLPQRPDPRSTPAARPATLPGGPSAPGPEGDPLSDVLRTVRLTGAVFFDVRASDPWVAEAPPARAIARHVRPGAQHVLEFHGIVAGACWGGLVGEPPIRLEAGDVIVFPHGDAHVLSSAPGMQGSVDLGFYERLPQMRLPVLVQEGPPGPPSAHVVCGFLGCDLRPFHPLIAALPRVLHHRARDAGDADWTAALLRQALVESQSERAGSGSVLTKLSELVFVGLVRRHMETLPPGASGWLGALRDPVVGRALALLHERPAHRWSLDQLARAVAASRSVLAERFRAGLGIPPMHYLTRWRMQLAADLLERTPAGIGAVAAEVGYHSEAAFHRAFRKIVGVPPGTWRRRRGIGTG